MSKRLAETVCDAAAQAIPGMGIVSLRLLMPANDESFAVRKAPPIDANGNQPRWRYLGPNDARRLFVAAVEYSTNPGHHVFHAAGDVEARWFPCTKAKEQMGWSPRGE